MQDLLKYITLFSLSAYFWRTSAINCDYDSLLFIDYCNDKRNCPKFMCFSYLIQIYHYIVQLRVISLIIPTKICVFYTGVFAIFRA